MTHSRITGDDCHDRVEMWACFKTNVFFFKTCFFVLKQQNKTRFFNKKNSTVIFLFLSSCNKHIRPIVTIIVTFQFTVFPWIQAPGFYQYIRNYTEWLTVNNKWCLVVLHHAHRNCWLLMVDQLSIFANFQFSIIVEWLSILFLFSADFSMFAVSLSKCQIQEWQSVVFTLYTQLHCLDSSQITVF